jgi:hypothetical protein
VAVTSLADFLGVSTTFLGRPTFAPLTGAVFRFADVLALPLFCPSSDIERLFPYTPSMIPSIGNATSMSGQWMAVPRPSSSEF